MLYGFINRVSNADELRNALDVSTTRTRLIADRVAKASLKGADGFALPQATAAKGSTADSTGPVDLEAEMVSLADEQLRFEATARLLSKAYQGIHTSIRSK